MLMVNSGLKRGSLLCMSLDMGGADDMRPLLGQRKNSDKHPLPPTKFLVNILIELVITDISGNPSTETGRQTT